MDSLACLNSELMPLDEARVPVGDRGFLFGDAVYEVLRIYGGRCWLEHEHLARLSRSLASLEFPSVDLDAVKERLLRTIAASKIDYGTAYIHLTRGVTFREHAFPGPEVPPTELIVVRSFDDSKAQRARESGVKVISQPDLRWKRCDIKSTNLLANVLAYENAKRAGGAEAILIDADGYVSEGTHTSVIWVRDGRLEGTPDGPEILPGTTRQLTLRLAKDINLAFRASRVSLEELCEADEVILVGTTTEILPVVRVDSTAIANERPGTVARKLQAAYLAAVQEWLSQPA